jgi:aspartate aminotransferase-like enzyme
MKRELLLIPGPTPVRREILDALAQETVSHVDPRMVKSFQNSLEMTSELFSCEGEVFVISGSGTLAMEIALINTVKPGERILILSHGYFGDRFIQLAESFGIEYDVISAEWGEHVAYEDVEAALESTNYKAVTITHVDTSTGVQANLDKLVPIIKEKNTLVILDGVCATAGIEENMSKQYGNGKIDVVLTGSQKALGVPPGLGIVAFSKDALKTRDEMERVPAYYADIKRWLPIMHDPSKYYATPSVNMVWAYEKALEIIFEEGLENRYERHIKYGKAVRKALGVYGMKAVADEEVAAATMSCVKYPEGLDDAKFRSMCYERGLVLAGGLASFAGNAFRIGHMGNTTVEELTQAIEIIGQVLIEMGKEDCIKDAIEMLKNNIR